MLRAASADHALAVLEIMDLSAVFSAIRTLKMMALFTGENHIRADMGFAGSAGGAFSVYESMGLIVISVPADRTDEVMPALDNITVRTVSFIRHIFSGWGMRFTFSA